MNEGAEARLDAFLPEWRARAPPGLVPEIIHQHRGAIPGHPGVWVYYRLTPLGERLATRLTNEIDPDSPRV